MKKFFILFLCVLFISCKTVDVSKKTQNYRTGGQGRIISNDNENASEQRFFIEPEVVYVEQPVFVPAPERPQNVTAPGNPSVQAANDAGIIKPQDYSHAAMVYNYHPDWVYEVYTQPVRVTDICLEPGEAVLEAPFVSDSERWIIGAGVSRENGIDVQHIYIKPAIAGIEASLIINTNRRVYRIILKSFSNISMPIVRWRYQRGIPNNYFVPPNPPVQLANANEIYAPESHLVSIDPRFLSFNYKIKHGLSKPYWLPEYVFDDGSKTYITFPLQVLQREFPAVFENRRDILNHRINGNMIIIDKLVENITVRIGKKQVTITKSKGK